MAAQSHATRVARSLIRTLQCVGKGCKGDPQPPCPSNTAEMRRDGGFVALATSSMCCVTIDPIRVSDVAAARTIFGFACSAAVFAWLFGVPFLLLQCLHATLDDRDFAQLFNGDAEVPSHEFVGGAAVCGAAATWLAAGLLTGAAVTAQGHTFTTGDGVLAGLPSDATSLLYLAFVAIGLAALLPAGICAVRSVKNYVSRPLTGSPTVAVNPASINEMGRRGFAPDDATSSP